MTSTIKVKVDGRQYKACFYDASLDQIKELKTNEAIDTEEYKEDGWWAIHFAYKDDDKLTLVVKFELDEEGERTHWPIGAHLLNEEGIIIDECRLQHINIKY